MEFKKIYYDTKEYQQTLALRDKVMRQPLGISIYDEDFTKEKQSDMVGIFDGEKLLGMGILTPMEDYFNVDFLCIDTEMQTQGMGKQILTYLEGVAKDKGAKRVTLEARMTALGFYEKLGYEKISDVYLLQVAPVELIRMEKKLV